MKRFLFLVFGFIFGVLLFSSPLVYGAKHPRAFQLEQSLRGDLDAMLKNLVADQPFSVTVTIDPLRRQGVVEKGSSRLPLMGIDDEIQDEWDDVDKLDYELLSRVNRISVKLLLPESFSKDQIENIKGLVRSRIPFVEGRDFIDVEQKNLAVAEQTEPSYAKWFFLFAGIMLVIYGGIHLLVNLAATNKLTKALKNIKIESTQSSSGAGALASASPSSYGAQEKSSFGSGQSSWGSGDVQLHDSIKMAEIVKDFITLLEQKEAFPVLEDMVLLEKEILKFPHSVGSLISTFPPHLRDRVFSYSYSKDWFKALLEGGAVDSKSFEIVSKLVKNSRDNQTYYQQQFLMVCWRSKDYLPEFLRQIEPDDAIAILRSLPRSLSIEVGRAVIPGKWAMLLETGHGIESLDELKIKGYQKSLLKKTPLRSSQFLEVYKKDLELIDYLKSVDPIVEKEVYLAAGDGSALVTLRAPFYKVLEAEIDFLKPFVSTIAIENWAHAFYNIPKLNRSHVEKCFTDRQRFLLVDLMKKFDKSGFDMQKVSYSRDLIAHSFDKYATQANSNKSQPTENQKLEQNAPSNGSKKSKNEAA